MAILLGAFAVYLLGYFVFPGEVVPERMAATELKRETLVSQARVAAIQGLGGIVLALGALLTVRTLRLTRDGQITDRFTKAVEHLGDKQLGVRVGAIHALGRIARDSRADQAAVMAILGDHLREYCAWPVRDAAARPKQARDKPAGAPHPEVVAAALVLRARRIGGEREIGHLDLSGIDWRGAPLSGVCLRRADLLDANLSGAFLRGADLRAANLTRARFDAASLDGADLREAELRGTRFVGAAADRTDFRDCELRQADFTEASLRDAKLPAGETPAGAHLGAVAG